VRRLEADENMHSDGLTISEHLVSGVPSPAHRVLPQGTVVVSDTRLPDLSVTRDATHDLRRAPLVQVAPAKEALRDLRGAASCRDDGLGDRDETSRTGGGWVECGSLSPDAARIKVRRKSGEYLFRVRSRTPPTPRKLRSPSHRHGGPASGRAGAVRRTARRAAA
jgi:hypothetical protein